MGSTVLQKSYPPVLFNKDFPLEQSIWITPFFINLLLVHGLKLACKEHLRMHWLGVAACDAVYHNHSILDDLIFPGVEIIKPFSGALRTHATSDILSARYLDYSRV